MKKTWLLYCRYALSGLRVYRTITDDLYNIIGYLHSNSIETIKRIDYNEETPERLAFWESEGVKIYDLKGHYDHK